MIFGKEKKEVEREEERKKTANSSRYLEPGMQILSKIRNLRISLGLSIRTCDTCVLSGIAAVWCLLHSAGQMYDPLHL